METRKIPLESDRYYHIYNRGINGQTIFLEEKNYSYFLQKYAQYVSPFVDTYAYSLLGNHFHFLIRAKGEEEIRAIINSNSTLQSKTREKSTSWHLSNAFASLFKSYAQAINKQYGRTGGLFEEPFHRIEVSDDTYFSRLVCYIHHNPQKHGFVTDFRDYPHSSYQSHVSEKSSKLSKAEVLNWFGGKEEYQKFHDVQTNDFKKINRYVVEFD